MRALRDDAEGEDDVLMLLDVLVLDELDVLVDELVDVPVDSFLYAFC